MKTQTQFKNASLVSVVDGSIVVKDSTGRAHTFTNASIVSVNNGKIVIESEWMPKRGELVKFKCGWCDTKYAIFKEIVGDRFWMYCSSIDKLTELPWDLNCPKYVSIVGSFTFSPVTQEEAVAFDDFCKSQGKIWNKEKLQWEKYKWEPKQCERYYYIDTLGDVSCTTNNTLQLDPARIKYGNCFPTKEQAKKAAEKLKEFFKSL